MPDSKNSDPLNQRWLVLDHLLKKLVKNYDVPQSAIRNLQHSRSLINFYNDGPTDNDRIKSLPTIDSLLNETEQNLMIIADNEGKEFVDEWNQKLIEASKGKEIFKVHKIQSRFIPGMPANFDFVRFNFKEEIQVERFYEICESENVIIEFDDNDKSVFIFGEKPNINNALKEMAPFYTEQINI